jgi:cyanophycin synthetase
MDNKERMREHFVKAALPIAQGGVCRKWEDAESLFNRLRKPVIVKPHFGSRSRHTTTHIQDLAGFRSAFKKAKELSPWVIIEEELSGMVFRGTVVGGKLVAVMRREPPFVIGDGSSKLEELLKKENERPERNGPIFHQIPQDSDMHEELSRQNFSLDSIPPKGKLVTLGQKVGRSNGASTSDVTDETHPDNRALLERVASVLGDSLVGIDFIMDSVETSWKNQNRCGIIECNSLPFIDLHHFPLFGKPRNVAAAVWDAAFPEA